MQIFLAFNALLYLGLGIWCGLMPQQTSASVGLSLVGSKGLAEYVAVYGGLEFALGLICTLLAFRSALYKVGTTGLCIFYACLIVFRASSLLRFGLDIQAGWYFLFFESSCFLIALFLILKSERAVKI